MPASTLDQAEEHRHPNEAICPKCRWPNNMPSECLRPAWTDYGHCSRCRFEFQVRGEATGPGRTEDGDYVIATRRPPEPAA